MKIKEWLKEQLNYLQEGVGESFNDYSKGLNAAYNTIEALINELEETEQKKVTIPDFVAGYIESLKHRGLNFYSGYRHAIRCSENGENNIQEWLDSQENLEIFARAWLDGYTVDKEKLYRVVLNHKQILWQATDGSGDIDIISRNRITTGKTKFTEQEIKNIDERYWQFAEEITK